LKLKKTQIKQKHPKNTKKMKCLLRLCILRVLLCSVCFCTGHFVMVPINLTCQHFLQHVGLPFTASQYCFGKVFPVWNFPAFYFMHANCPNGDGNRSSFGRFRYYYVNYRTFARRYWPSCSDYDDVMLFLAECIRIFTTWQAIPFKRKCYVFEHLFHLFYNFINFGYSMKSSW